MILIQETPAEKRQTNTRSHTHIPQTIFSHLRLSCILLFLSPPLSPSAPFEARQEPGDSPIQLPHRKHELEVISSPATTHKPRLYSASTRAFGEVFISLKITEKLRLYQTTITTPRTCTYVPMLPSSGTKIEHKYNNKYLHTALYSINRCSPSVKYLISNAFL